MEINRYISFILTGLTFLGVYPNGDCGLPIHVKVGKGQTLTDIFRRQRLVQKDIYYLMSSLAVDDDSLEKLSPGQAIQIEAGPTRRVSKMRVHQKDGSLLEFIRNGQNGFVCSRHNQPHEKIKAVDFYVHSSIYTDGSKVGLSPAQIKEASSILNKYSPINVNTLRRGSQVTIYLNQSKDNHSLGQIMAIDVSYKNMVKWSGTRYYSDGDYRFYNANGSEPALNFSRFPLAKFRVSSPFSVSRLHPIYHIRRPHYGVDLASPKGQPVNVTADGRINFMGVRGNYGRVIIVDHGQGYQTIYAHLSGYMKGLKKGDQVRQSQVIGYVGSSGAATGPHLHYEIRHLGQPKNPMNFSPSRPRGSLGTQFKAFKKYHDQLRTSSHGVMSQMNNTPLMP